MKWFQHSCGSAGSGNESKFIFQLIDKFGGDGYMVYFIAMEIIGDDFDVYNPGFCRVPVKYFRTKCRLSRQKLLNILKYCEGKERITVKLIEGEEEELTLNCSKFADICDNYTQKLLRAMPEQDTESVRKKTSQEVEKISQEEIEVEDTVPYSDFYKLFPRHEGKAAGEKAWKKIKDKEKPEIIEALQKQIKTKHLNVEDKKYCPLPATWLNGRRWEDDIIPKQDDDNEGEKVMCRCGAVFMLKYQGQECPRCQKPYPSEGQRPQEG